MNKNIACIGAGYIGGPTMAVIAKMNPKRKVIIADLDAERIAAWNSPDYKLPIYEPGLKEIVKAVRGKNLFFTTDVKYAVNACDIVFVGVNTPTKLFGKGAGKASDLQYLEAAARTIKRVAKHPKIVIEKSTLPVRTAAALEAILGTRKFTVLSNPEFLAEGSAINDLLKPDRVLIGGPDTTAGKAAVKAAIEIYSSWVPKKRILTTNVWSAELTKLAANAFLAQRVSSINAIAGLCEVTGADVDEVSRVIGADHRIGPKFLKAGPGFGGSCFKKDVLNLVYLCESFGLHTAANYWNGVVEMNEHQQERIVTRLFKSMFNTLAGKRIAIFGFAFKADTGDTRETPALAVSKMLVDEHAQVVITDPKAMDNAKRELGGLAKKVEFALNEYEAARDADAIVVMTDWANYLKLNWRKIYASMRKPALLFDTRNCLDAAKLKRIGFNLLNVGK